MVWKRRHKLAIKYYIIVLCSISLSISNTIAIQAQDSGSKKSIWTDDQWREIVRDKDYSAPKKRKQKEKMEAKELNTPSNRFSEFLNHIFTSNTSKVIFVALIIGLLTVSIIKFTSQKTRGKLERKISFRPSIEDFNKIEEKLPEQDLERFLQFAINSKDYKQAIRILFLITIQRLNHNGSITWKLNKTNHDYLIEMMEKSDYKYFSNLTQIYEIIWYGDTNVDLTSFNSLYQIFNQFIEKLQPEVNEQY